jgi:nitroreductase
MDSFLAIVSKRDTRSYAGLPVPGETVERILEAGRLAGSARNRQPWRLFVVESTDRRERLAEAVYAPDNVRGAQLIIAVVGSSGLDGGRCIQNMMLAAWNEGVASCPNGIADSGRAREALGLDGDDDVAVVLSFGYPAHGRTGESRTVEEWISRADRKPLDEVVRRI